MVTVEQARRSGGMMVLAQHNNSLMKGASVCACFLLVQALSVLYPDFPLQSHQKRFASKTQRQLLHIVNKLFAPHLALLDSKFSDFKFSSGHYASFGVSKK